MTDSNHGKFVDIQSYFFEYLRDDYLNFTEEDVYWLLSKKVKLEEILFFLERGVDYLDIPDYVELYGVERWEKMEDTFYEKGLDIYPHEIVYALEKENWNSSS